MGAFRVGLLAVLSGCLAAKSAVPAPPPAKGRFRLNLCSEAPVHLVGPAGEAQSRGCVATFTQEWSDAESIRWLGTNHTERRYLVYAPARLPDGPVPVVFMFPGATASAEAAAFYYTHTRFETLADRDGFLVVYGNGLPKSPLSDEHASSPKGGFLPGCWAGHADEGLDVTYVRTIVKQLETELKIDRTRIYATGLSMGGGMSFQLALEAPDLVAAVAPVAPVPFQPGGDWLKSCHPKPGYGQVSVAMLAATADPYIAYAPGSSVVYPYAQYPGMEQTRDAWMAAMKIAGAPLTDKFPDVVDGDSFKPHTGVTSSTVERQRFPPGPEEQELWYYKAESMGHWWPSPLPMWQGLWQKYGKTNQDIDFADHAWEFFQRHRKRPAAP